MANRSSSKQWRRRQESDPYVRRAQQEGWRSRAVYKLIEIQERERLITRSANVLDLGAAPGAWSQYAQKLTGPDGAVIAVDLLPMDAIPGVEFIQGDFREDETLERLLSSIDERQFNLVMSDMAPNISGNKSVDQPRVMYLAELAIELASRILTKNGAFVVKLFHGEGFDEFVKAARTQFKAVKVRKPKASRPHSRETYLVARGLRL